MKIDIYQKRDLQLQPDVPGASMWAVALDKAMLTYFELEPDTVFPEHSHVAEQITMVLEGELTFRYDGKEVTLKRGEVIAIPSNAVHSAFTGTLPCKAVDAWSPPRLDFLYPKIGIRPALPEDIGLIKEYIEKFRLDDEYLEFSQFVVAVKGDCIAGFGRIRPHREVYELGAIGVIEDMRGKGIGSMIVQYLINTFPTDDVFITTVIPEYFQRFGFRKIDPGPRELVEKIQRVCKSKHRGEAVVMARDRNKTGKEFAVK